MNIASHVYELVIVGCGPAGITAAIYSARKKVDFIVVTTNIGGRVTSQSEVEGYIGYQFVTGVELYEKFQEHLQKYEFEYKAEEVLKIEREGSLFTIKTDKHTYLSQAVIVATGRKPRELKVSGENTFKNKGITYCATCDAPLFGGLDVAVIGGGNLGLEAALQLTKFAKTVFLIEVNSKLNADPALIEKVRSLSNVNILTNTRVTKFFGDEVLKGIKVIENGSEKQVMVSGAFIEIGFVPNSTLIDLPEKNKNGEIMVNCGCETSVPGLFAAGDISNIPDKQIVIAAGDGCKAALSAFRYVSVSKL